MGEKEKDLTPEQQQAEDAAQIRNGFGATDALERFAIVMDRIGFGGGSGPGGYFGTTDFEKKQLNEMLDLVENSNPADLEAAGEALVKAKDALNEAAKDLADYVTKSDWTGEAATEFNRFGKALAAHASDLATFANAAGTQMTVASTGLTSVRNSMPRERDTRLFPKTVEAFALMPGKETNPEYIEAVKVEKNRQEAINQMNRLASFYAVSESSLAGQEVPKFPGMLNADVPPPRVGERGTESGATASGTDDSGATTARGNLQRAEVGGEGGTSRTEALEKVTTVPDRNTSMEIDSVTAPPVPTTGSGVTPPTSAAGPVGPSGGQVPPVAGGFVNPVRGGAPRSTSTSGMPRAGGAGASAVGRPGAAGSGSAAAGRAGGAGAVSRPGAVGSGSAATGRAGAVGRPGAMGGGAAAGRTGAAAAGRTPVAGRPGAGGQPTAGRTGTGASAGPRAGRADGIVGGTPQRGSTGSAGSRIPRGNVIGSEGAAPGRSATARPSQSGVIGTNPANGAPRPTGRGTPSSNGVIGTPRSGAPASRPGAGGFTAGGAGFAGGRPGQRQSENDEQERTGSARPDYLTEDEETWAARRRGAIPPVID
ncbi:hypothetical protein [Streptomyces sp. NPDC000880]